MCCERESEELRSIKAGNFLTSSAPVSRSGRTLMLGISYGQNEVINAVSCVWIKFHLRRISCTFHSWQISVSTVVSEELAFIPVAHYKLHRLRYITISFLKI